MTFSWILQAVPGLYLSVADAVPSDVVFFSAAKTPGDLVKEMEEKKLVLNRKVCPNAFFLIVANSFIIR